MQESNLYNSSSFFEDMDGELASQFTDMTPLSCKRPWLSIHRARRFGQWWIVKSVNPQFSPAEKAQELINSEFARVIMMWHPNIARVITQQGVPLLQGQCIVEEWIDGVSLDSFLVSQPNLETRLGIAKQLIEAVRYAASKGVAHGNLKPSNVLITHNGSNVKLIDFEPNQPSGGSRADIIALAGLLKLLQLPKKYNSVIKRCMNGKYGTMEQLNDDFGKAETRQPLRWIAIAVAAIVVIAAAIAAFTFGGRKQQEERKKLPEGYVVDSIVPGANVTFSTISLADVYYLPFDSITPGNIPDTMAVDLGLSVKWAKMNMGASHPSVNFVGSFYCWGDTTDKTKWGEIDAYWPQERSMPTTPISGTDIDFVHERWGGKWRMPTLEEFSELITKCDWKFRNAGDGAAGYVVTGTNGNSIFMPLAGWSDDGINYQNIGRYGYYWTANPSPDGKRMAHYIFFDEAKIISDKTNAVNCLMTIRPVLDQ